METTYHLRTLIITQTSQHVRGIFLIPILKIKEIIRVSYTLNKLAWHKNEVRDDKNFRGWNESHEYETYLHCFEHLRVTKPVVFSDPLALCLPACALSTVQKLALPQRARFCFYSTRLLLLLLAGVTYTYVCLFSLLMLQEERAGEPSEERARWREILESCWRPCCGFLGVEKT